MDPTAPTSDIHSGRKPESPTGMWRRWRDRHQTPVAAFPTAAEADDPTIPATFEGRRLDRPGQEIQDQGLSFDIGTVMDRRRMLGVLGIGAGAAALAACSTGSESTAASSSAAAGSTTATTGTQDITSIDEMPTETNGPYPADGTNGPDVLDTTGVERSDIRASIGSDTPVDGVELTLGMRIIDISNDFAPYAGAAVYIWQCDAEGRYSMYSEGVENETYLRGVQIADDDGRVTFKTIFPGCYSGRWPHIHFEVFPDKASTSEYTNNVLVSQLAMPQDRCDQVYQLDEYSSGVKNYQAFSSVADDDIFADSYQMQIPATSGSAAAGYTMTIDVGIDPTTEQEMGGGQGGPGGPGGTPPDGAPGGTPPDGAPGGAGGPADPE